MNFSDPSFKNFLILVAVVALAAFLWTWWETRR